MAKKNPFDTPPPPAQPKPIRVDADLRNADWPKRTKDVDAFTGEYSTPKIDQR